MSSFLRKVFDEIVSVLGGDYDKPRPSTPAHGTANTPPPLSPPHADDTPDFVAMNGLRITAADCRVCGHRLNPGSGDKQFCSWQCEQRLSDSMDAWHDQFESRFGDD